MADFTRRGFLGTMSITTGVGIAGGLGLHRLLANDAPKAEMTAAAPVAPVAPLAPLAPGQPDLAGVTLAGPMVIHIRDLATAEIAMLVGTQELVYRDPELVSRLVQTAATAGNGRPGA